MKTKFKIEKIDDAFFITPSLYLLWGHRMIYRSLSIQFYWLGFGIGVMFYKPTSND